MVSSHREHLVLHLLGILRCIHRRLQLRQQLALQREPLLIGLHAALQVTQLVLQLAPPRAHARQLGAKVALLGGKVASDPVKLSRLARARCLHAIIDEW